MILGFIMQFQSKKIRFLAKNFYISNDNFIKQGCFAKFSSDNFIKQGCFAKFSNDNFIMQGCFAKLSSDNFIKQACFAKKTFFFEFQSDAIFINY